MTPACRRFGLLAALVCAAAHAGCDRLSRLERSAALSEIPPWQCIDASLRALPWVERTSTSTRLQAATVTVVPRAGLQFDVVTQPDLQPGNTAGTITLSWWRMNVPLDPEEMGALRSHMKSAYLAVRARCPGLPDFGATREWCDVCAR